MNDEDGLKKIMMGPTPDFPIVSKAGSIYNEIEITYMVSLLKKKATTYSTPDMLREVSLNGR